jgi:hypothetical protein
MLGVVIGTYGSVPYVHCHLESARRNYPVPILVHDDCSPQRLELLKLCHDYGTDFQSTPCNLGHQPGDAAVFHASLLWAKQRGIELLVKLSRSCLPTRDWREGLLQLAKETQYATYSNECRRYNYGFRTEILALHVDSWLGVINDLAEYVAARRIDLPEQFIHDLARRLHADNCQLNRDYEKLHPPTSGKEAYGVWDFIGTNRHHRRPELLWHDCCLPADYLQYSLSLGLPYQSDTDFKR